MKRSGYYDVDGKFYTKDKNAKKENPLAPRGPKHHHIHYFDGLNMTGRDLKIRTSSHKKSSAASEIKTPTYADRKRNQVIVIVIAFTVFLIAYITIMIAISFMGLIW